MRKFLFLCMSVLLFSMFVNAQSLKGYLHGSESWYGGEESLIVAENVLLQQKDNGGWAKNYRYYWKAQDENEKAAMISRKGEVTESTIDNKATFSEMVFLAQMYQAVKDNTYKDAFLKGLDFLFSIQYDNGGFKQFSRDYGYYTHITYNDNAMMNVMTLFQAILDENHIFDGIMDDSLRAKVKASYWKGVDCILKTQYVQHGKKTVWCAQHDEFTMQPANARAYELASLSGSESVGIVLFLMNLEQPTPEIKEAIAGAMQWFDENRITDMRMETYTNADGKNDRRMVKSSQGSDVWGRFYELDTNRPFVCDRDGIIKYDISEIGYERRNGYSWYTNGPNGLFPKYEKWKAKHIQ